MPTRLSMITDSAHSTGNSAGNHPTRPMLDQINAARGEEARRDLRTHGGELRRRRRVQRVVGGRELVEEGRHVHLLDAVEALGAVQRPDLRAQPAHHEVLEDPRRRPHLRRRNRRSPASREGSSARRWAPPSLYGVGSVRARAEGGRRSGGGRGQMVVGCGAGGRRRGPTGRVVVGSFDPLRIWRQFIFPLFCLCLTVLRLIVDFLAIKHFFHSSKYPQGLKAHSSV